MAEAELQDSTERAFEAYWKQLETVATLKYLGRVVMAGDDKWPAVGPACPGYRDNLGGGKPPTPKMLTMRHAGPMKGAKG